MATLATIVALPVLVNGLRSGSEGATPVAAVPGGAALADSLRPASSGAVTTKGTVPAQRSNLPRASLPTPPPVLEIAIPEALPSTSAKGTASYRRFASGRRSDPACASPVAPVGARVEVVNVDNGHLITCVVVGNVQLPKGQVIAVDATAFAVLADPVLSPIPVRITW